MSELRLLIDRCSVSAWVRAADDSRHTQWWPCSSGGSGADEFAPESAWQAVVAATRALIGDRSSLITGLEICDAGQHLLVWDAETTGAARPGVCLGESPGAVRDHLAALEASDPRVWELIRQGRCLVGTMESYVVARMTRGLWHVIGADRAATTGLLDYPGLPQEHQPDPIATAGRAGSTDPTTFLRLQVPIRLG